jgi:hypothetical protein
MLRDQGHEALVLFLVGASRIQTPKEDATNPQGSPNFFAQSLCKSGTSGSGAQRLCLCKRGLNVSCVLTTRSAGFVSNSDLVLVPLIQDDIQLPFAQFPRSILVSNAHNPA